jgi:hypothetical protein
MKAKILSILIIAIMILGNIGNLNAKEKFVDVPMELDICRNHQACLHLDDVDQFYTDDNETIAKVGEHTQSIILYVKGSRNHASDYIIIRRYDWGSDVYALLKIQAESTAIDTGRLDITLKNGKHLISTHVVHGGINTNTKTQRLRMDNTKQRHIQSNTENIRRLLQYNIHR